MGAFSFSPELQLDWRVKYTVLHLCNADVAANKPSPVHMYDFLLSLFLLLRKRGGDHAKQQGLKKCQA